MTDIYDKAREVLDFATGGDYDWESDHFAATPQRFIKMLQELTTGVPFDFTVFPNEGADAYEGVIVVGPVHFTALCSHHVLAFPGRAWVAYVPNGYICGLSKLARCVKSISRGLWTQEHLTQTIADALDDTLDPLGLAVRMEAEHMCMTLRGVHSPGTITTTQVLRGVFLDHEKQARSEFLEAVEATR